MLWASEFSTGSVPVVAKSGRLCLNDAEGAWHIHLTGRGKQGGQSHYGWPPKIHISRPGPIRPLWKRHV